MLQELLEYSVKKKASDLHLSAGLPPVIRIDGHLKKLPRDPISHEALSSMLADILTADQKQEFKESLEIDFSYELPKLSRFRVNIFKQSRGIAAAFRLIPAKIKTLESLELPEIFKQIASLKQGLVLVTGPTGSGKSTTLAAMVDYVNETKQQHIITIEDPIEFIYEQKRSLVNQREVGTDTHSFNHALRSALREDPDIILIGELRDTESINLALTAAETGHLVFASLHTMSAAKTIDRIINSFSASEKEQIRIMLSTSLKAVIAQTLVHRLEGGRIPAFEIMLSTPAIQNLIRENKLSQIYSTIQTNAKHGMHTLQQYLQKLSEEKIISQITAEEAAPHELI